MPDTDAMWVRDTARKQGYAAADFERCHRLAALLADVGQSPWLRDRVALKGGTCINFFHDDLPRLSVDMDLDYVGSLDRLAMLAERPELERALQELAAARGYTVDVERRSYAGSKTRFLYTNVQGQRDSIRVDLNYLMRLPLYGVERRELPGIFELDGRVPTLALEDVYGGKLKALAARAQPRDLFDAARLFGGSVRPDLGKLRAAFLFYCYMDDATLRLVDLGRAAALTDEEVRRNLHPMLRAGERPAAGQLKDAVLPRMEEMGEEGRRIAEKIISLDITLCKHGGATTQSLGLGMRPPLGASRKRAGRLGGSKPPRHCNLRNIHFRGLAACPA